MKRIRWILFLLLVAALKQVPASAQSTVNQPDSGLYPEDFKKEAAVPGKLVVSAAPLPKERPESAFDGERTSLRQRNGVTLIYRVTPDWLLNEPTVNWNPYLGAELTEIWPILSTEQKRLVFGPGLPLDAEPQLREVFKLLHHPFEAAPTTVAAQHAETVHSVVNAPKSIFKITMYPTLYVYGDREALGLIRLEDGKVKNFKPLEKWPAGRAVANWTHAPRFIDCKMEYTGPEQSVNIPESRAYTLSELSNLFEQKARVPIALEPQLAGIRVLVSGAAWDLATLLQSVCTVSGTEVTRSGSRYAWSPSAAQAQLARTWRANWHQTSINQIIMAQWVAGRGADEVRAKLEPFASQDFAAAEARRLTDLTPEQRSLVLSADAGFGAKIKFVRPVLGVSISVVSEVQTASAPSGVTNSYMLSAIPAKAPLTDPATE